MKRFKRFVGAGMLAGILVTAPVAVFGGDPDMPSGVTEDGTYAERCWYLGDAASCLMAFWDWFMDQSLL